jgi:nitroreductase
METIQTIRTRRSIRAFKPEPVPNETIQTILEAAMFAPSACNAQPWHFIVIDDRHLLDTIPTFHPYSKMLKEASLAVVVCADPRLEVVSGYWVQDCSAATQNLLLAIHDCGLGGVWLGVYPDQERVKKVQNLLNMPEEIIPLCVVAAGWPAEEKAKEERFNLKRVHHNGW